MTADGLGGGEKTVKTGGRIRDMTEKLIGQKSLSDYRLAVQKKIFDRYW